MAKRYRFKAKDGTAYEWSAAELGDTLFESEAWESPATKKRVRALKVGESVTRKGERLTRVGTGRSANPRPSLAELGVMSEHGWVHELVVEAGDNEQKHTWRGRYPRLFWSAPQRALVFVHGIKLPRPRKGEPPRDDGAAATYERFEGRAADSWRDGVPIPKAKLRELGRAVSIAYRNEDKWGGVAEHPFGPSVRAWVGKLGRTKVYVISGGRLRMTAGGIEG